MAKQLEIVQDSWLLTLHS